MKKLFIILFLFPFCLLAQDDPIENTPDPTPDTDGLEGSSASKAVLTIDGNFIINGNLIVNGSVLWPPAYTEPNPDPYPGDNPLPIAQNAFPEAFFTYTPTTGDFPLTVNVDGTTSTDSDGTIASYSWNWGDGTTTSGSTSTHNYTSAGNYSIVLVVTDDDGATSITQPKTVNVTTPVVNSNPVASFTTDVATGTSPLTVNVDASGSYDTDGTIADPAGYVWDFDTGSPASGTGSTDSTTFTGAGTYTITLTVTDDDTLTSVTTKQIEVAAAPASPVASFTATPTSGNIPLTVNVDASASTDPDGTIASYAWTFDDTTADAQAYTYYRFEATADSYDAGARWAIWNIAGYESDDWTGTDEFSASFADAFSVSGFNENQHAFNGESSSSGLYWDSFTATSGNYRWIYVELTSPKTIRSIDYRARFTGADVGGWTPTEIKIQGSNDALSWTDLKLTVPLADAFGAQLIANAQSEATTTPSTGTGVTTSHIYDTVGTYTIGLTVTDNAGLTSATTRQVQASDGATPEYDMTVAEAGHRSLSLTWTDAETWSKPWVIQRSTTTNFVKPTTMVNNQAADNTGAGTFRFLGINADNYVDIDGLAEGTTYYYRVGVVTNLSDHYQNGTAPTFGTWLYGAGTTTTLGAGQKLTYNITNGSYAGGAVSGDGLNDWPAINAALTAAQAAGGGIIYIPAGSWDVWPTDADVDIVGGYPEIESGESIASSLFNITSDNITFLGDASGGVPTSLIQLYLWGKEPATKWLNVLSGATGSAVANVKRYFVFAMNDVSDFTIQNLNIDMGADPVNSGKAWQGLDAKRYQWDISHKLFAAFDLKRFRNVVIDTLYASDCRGEVIYTGGGSEKILVKNSDFRRANSSIFSGSYDLELVNTTIADGANAAVESALLNDRISYATGLPFPQNHIARGNTFIGLDQSANGVMKDLPGLKNFGGWYVFNEAGTYQSVTDSTFTDFIFSSFSPWYEYRNGLRFNCTFNPFTTSAAGHVIFTWTSEQSDYTLAGGMSEILWLGDTINISRTLTNSQPIFYSQVGAAAAGNQSPWTWEAVEFVGIGGTRKIQRLWVDTWSHTTGRQNALFKDWTATNITFDANYLQFLNANHIDPTYINSLPLR